MMNNYPNYPNNYNFNFQMPQQQQPESFLGYYVNDYNEVINSPSLSNGKAILFVNVEHGKAWAKKMINGQVCITPYSMMPIYTEQTQPPQPTQEQNKTDDNLRQLIREEITNVLKEGKSNGVE